MYFNILIFEPYSKMEGKQLLLHLSLLFRIDYVYVLSVAFSVSTMRKQSFN